MWPTLLICAQPSIVWGGTQQLTLSKDLGKKSPLGWEKETPFKIMKQISTSPDIVQLLEFPLLININVSHSCWLVLHLDNQIGLINFSLFLVSFLPCFLYFPQSCCRPILGLGMEEEPTLKSTHVIWDKCLREIPGVARLNQVIYGMKQAT